MSGWILVHGLGKRFRVHHPHRPTTLHETLARGIGRLGAAETFWALRDVDLEVEAGDSLGLVGSNGAGKSTLLRLIARVGRPDEGRVEVRGRLGALLDLGAGFHGDLTGRENVYITGVVSGLLRAEVEERFDRIVAFSELEAFIDSPLRTYSTGMRMRLAFAVAAVTDPEVLLVDEVLAVGDLRFQRKCMERLERLRERGATLLLCSHDLESVAALCRRVAWLEEGRLRSVGPAAEVLEAYVEAADARG